MSGTKRVDPTECVAYPAIPCKFKGDRLDEWVDGAVLVFADKMGNILLETAVNRSALLTQENARVLCNQLVHAQEDLGPDLFPEREE